MCPLCESEQILISHDENTWWCDECNNFIADYMLEDE